MKAIDVFLSVMLLAGLGFIAYAFFRQPKEKQLAQLQEWLLLAVVEAEALFSAPGTGEIKLRYVYDRFVSRFKGLAGIITFERFSAMVEVTLGHMRELIQHKPQVLEDMKTALKDKYGLY